MFADVFVKALTPVNDTVHVSIESCVLDKHELCTLFDKSSLSRSLLSWRSSIIRLKEQQDTGKDTTCSGRKMKRSKLVTQKHAFF